MTALRATRPPSRRPSRRRAEHPARPLSTRRRDHRLPVAQHPAGHTQANPEQPRKRFDDAAPLVLANAISERGVLQPVIVKAAEDGYELVVAERRWRRA
jgi:ParB family transcriptional regulator, chromosome partitioning protein